MANRRRVKEVLKALEVKEGIYWVGAVDWEERDFHNFEIQRGTTYNAYLIVDEKITLVDTVKNRFFHEMMEKIRGLVDPSRIDYIIVNHIEPDHAQHGFPNGCRLFSLHERFKT
jgi:flavorubredoxin